MNKLKRRLVIWRLKRLLRLTMKVRSMLLEKGVPLTGHYSVAAAAEKLLEAGWLLGMEDYNG